MQQNRQVLFLVGIFFAFVAGMGVDQPWLPVGLVMLDVFAFIGAAMTDVMIFVGGAVLVVVTRGLFSTALSSLWKTHR